MADAFVLMTNILEITVSIKRHVGNFEVVSQSCHFAISLRRKQRFCYHVVFSKDLGDVWSIRTFDRLSWNPGNANALIFAYDRPTYMYESGIRSLSQNDTALLVYTGSRWFVMTFVGEVAF